MAIFLVAFAGFQRAEHTQFALHRSAAPVSDVGDALGDADVVIVVGGVLPSASSEPSIMTEVKPFCSAVTQVASLLPWSRCMQIGMCG